MGWFGAVGAFLALAVAGVMSENADIVRGSYLAMHLITWLVIVPFCLAALLTGIAAASAATRPMGCVWTNKMIVASIVSTNFARTHRCRNKPHVVPSDCERALSSSDLRQLRLQLIGDACAALFVLMVTTALSVYKPWGLTAYGLRMQSEATPTWRPVRAQPSATWVRYALFGVLCLAFLFLVLHFAGGRLHGH